MAKKKVVKRKVQKFELASQSYEGDLVFDRWMQLVEMQELPAAEFELSWKIVQFDIDSVSSHGWTLLNRACFLGRSQTAVMLLRLGANAQMQDSTVTREEAEDKSMEKIKGDSKAKAKPDAKSSKGKKPSTSAGSKKSSSDSGSRAKTSAKSAGGKSGSKSKSAGDSSSKAELEGKYLAAEGGNCAHAAVWSFSLETLRAVLSHVPAKAAVVSGGAGGLGGSASGSGGNVTGGISSASFIGALVSQKDALGRTPAELAKELGHEKAVRILEQGPSGGLSSSSTGFSSSSTGSGSSSLPRSGLPGMMESQSRGETTNQKKPSVSSEELLSGASALVCCASASELNRLKENLLSSVSRAAPEVLTQVHREDGYNVLHVLCGRSFVLPALEACKSRRTEREGDDEESTKPDDADENARTQGNNINSINTTSQASVSQNRSKTIGVSAYRSPSVMQGLALAGIPLLDPCLSTLQPIFRRKKIEAVAEAISLVLERVGRGAALGHSKAELQSRTLEHNDMWAFNDYAGFAPREYVKYTRELAACF